MIVEGYSHYLILQNSKDKIHVTQYALKESEIKANYDSNNQIQYRISFENDKWIVYSKSYDDKIYGNYFNAGFDAEVPYSFCQRLSVFGIAHYFDLYVKDSSIKTAKAANISLINSSSYIENDGGADYKYSYLLEDKDKFNVRLTTSGNWDEINNELSLYFTSFMNYVTLDTKGCDSKASIKQFDFANLSRSSIPIDIEINDTTKRDNNDLSTVSASTGSSELINEIKNLFNNENLDTSVDHVVTVITTEKPVEIFGLEESNNKFIRLEGNEGTFNFINGSLNVMINESSKITVNIDKNEDVKLTIKNMDSFTIVLDVVSSDVEEEQKKKNITITSPSNVYGPLTFELGNNIQSVNIDSINLHESGSLTSDHQITVTNLIAQPNTNGKLENVAIDKDFVIEQSAILELDGINLEKANINLNLHTYNEGNFNEPLLKGKFGKSPSSIVVSKV